MRQWREMVLAVCLMMAGLHGVARAELTLPALTAASTPASEATLIYMNRDVVVFRAALAGVTPEKRVRRAERRLADHERTGDTEVVGQVPITIGTQQGIGITLNDTLLFTLLPEDRDPEDGRPLSALADGVVVALKDALAARHAQTDPANLIKGLLFAGLALAATALAVILLMRLRHWLAVRLQRQVLHRLEANMPWLSYLAQVLERLVQIVVALVCIALGYLWVTYALAQFPLTRPFGDQLGNFLLGLLGNIGMGVVRALPDLITLAIILLITRALTQSVKALFDAVQEGRIQLPGLYSETVGASRRLVTIVIWALGITFAYPYIPGSQSDVFKGLSVLFGFMLTLGSAGVVNQLMSGMTLVYSRALRKGDLVQIGETMGVVEEIGTLSTRVVNLYNEVITIPNSVVMSNQIRNYSRQEEGQGVMVGCKVTIGYDTPWRQVEAMLLNAAKGTPGLRDTPAPCVLQRALSDFYVEYELMVTLADTKARPFVLTRLHAEVQDEFNRYGVQIMSPNFRGQPDGGAVVVPQEDWYKAPAASPSRPAIPE